jgi:hypothetical protein
VKLYFVFLCPVPFIPITLSDPFIEVMFEKSFEILKMFSVMGFRFSENNIVSSANVSCNLSENFIEISLFWNGKGRKGRKKWADLDLKPCL